MINLRENEKIVKIVRQHQSVMSGTIVWSVLFAGLASFALLRSDLNILGYSWEIIVGVMLIATIIILYKICVWRKNALVITDQRVLLDRRQGILSRMVTELLYRDIYEISFRQVGLLSLLSRYGQLVIKTPSGSEITFDKVPSPADVVRIINEARSKESEKLRN